jgi:hypothetical protein
VKPVIALLGLLAGCPDAAWSALAGEQQPSVGSAAEASAVVRWNELAYEVAYAEDQFLTFKGQRALAMLNLAMHDALNTVSARYDRYTYHGHAAATADATLAATHAAYHVLRALYPNATARLDSLLAAKAAGTKATYSGGAELGAAVASAVLALRHGDGWDAAGSYVFSQGAGVYQTTPDWNGFVLQPGFRSARPFAIRTVKQFLPPPPPPLNSTRYARAYAEVMSYGARRSAVRTAEQSAYAMWWLEFAEGSVNRLARRLVTERSTDAWEAARLFALLHMSLYDGYIATWEAKYRYNFWRPYTAIRFADDGNARTAPDTGWESLLPAPPFPEYVSAHATGCSAAFTVLATSWPKQQAFTMTTRTAPPEMPERSFASFRAAAEECADSRVMLGWHFRFATDAGLELGQRIAREVMRTQLRAR